MRQFFFYSALMSALALPVGAVSFYGNQSTIRWKSATTEHFVYHYPSEYQEHAAQIGRFTEAVYDSITKRYHSELPGKVDLVIRNSLFSNGEANPVYNMMNVWLTDWDFKIRSTHNWMNDVVTHEFSHLVSIQSGSKLPSFIHGLQFSYQDYANERTKENAAAVVPFTIMPLWFAEGTAQYESARMGFDAWDTHRDMLLRTAVLNDQMMPLTSMHDFPEDALGSELGPYNQGFSLVRYIAAQYGDAAVPALWAELRRAHRSTMNGALQQTLGIGEQELYNKWKAERVAHYQAQRDRIGTLRQGIKRSADGSYQDAPTLAGGYLYGLSNFGGRGLDGSLFRVPLRLDTLTDDRKPDSTGVLPLAEFAFDDFETEKAWLEQGISVRHVPERGPLFAYVTYRNRDRNGKAYFDIVVADTLGRHRPVTRFADAVYPDLAPDGRSVVFVRREADGTRFHLSRAPVGAIDGKPDDYTDIFSPPDSLRYFGIYTPRHSPDGKTVAFSFFDGVSRKVGLVDADGKNLRVMVAGDFDARDPAWSPDGKSLYYSCDRTGIYNLYKLDLTSGAVAPVTRVLGGAFSPVVDSTGLYYIGYDQDGFSLYQLPADSLALALAPDSSASHMRERPRQLSMSDLEFAGVQRNYLPIPRLPVVVPLFSIEERSPDFGAVAQGVPVPKAGVAVGLQDPLQKNFVQMALLLEVSGGFDFLDENGLAPSKQSDFLTSWENRSTPVTLSLAYMRRNITGRDTVRYEDARSHNDSVNLSHYAVGVNALQGGAGYSLFKRGDSLSVMAGYDWAAFNLYEDHFAWDYHKRLSAGTVLSWRSAVPGSGSNAAGAGQGVTLVYNHARTQLYRPGTFAESFTVSSQGVITPHYRDYQLHEAALSLFGSVANPLHAGARLAGGVHGMGLLAWSGQDTLDNFYRYPLQLDGYPLLLNSETYNRQGQRTAIAELHYLFPLYNDWRHQFWIFTTRDLYVDLFAQTGAAWDASGVPSTLRKREAWDRSVGLEWRWSNRLFYTYPFDVSLKLARGLDRAGEEADGSGGLRLEPVGVPWLPDAVAPTRVQFSVGMGFANSWMGSRGAGR